METNMNYGQWSVMATIVDAKEAWKYQQKKIDELIQEWETSVLWGKDNLKKTIDELTEENKKMKAKMKAFELKLKRMHEEANPKKPTLQVIDGGGNLVHESPFNIEG